MNGKKVMAPQASGYLEIQIDTKYFKPESAKKTIKNRSWNE